MSKFTDFVAQYTGKSVDFDGVAGAQLVPVFKLRQFSNFSGFFKRMKSTKMYLFIIHLYSNCPFISGLIPMNTINSRRIVTSNLSVSQVSSVVTNSKINSSVVQRIMVYMVNVLSLLRVKQVSLKFNDVVVNPFLNIVTTSLFRKTPFTTKFFKSFQVSFINLYFMCTKSFTNYFKYSHQYSLPYGSHSCNP